MNTKKLAILLCLFTLVFHGSAQTLPPERAAKWTLAGLRDTTTSGFAEINMQSAGVLGDGVYENDSVMNAVLAGLNSPGSILQFPAGNFLFKHTIVLPSNVVIRGLGAAVTTFTMDLGGTGHAFDIFGNSVNTDTSSILQSALKDSSSLLIANAVGFSAGNWIQIVIDDTDLVTSSWAYGTVGQILAIENITGNLVQLKSPLRMEFGLDRSPLIRKIQAVHNVGIECLGIHRIDNTAPEQSSIIHLRHAVNCWIDGVETYNCTFSHIEAESCANILVARSYLHHAFDYGDGGRGYGVMLDVTSSECRVQDNVFEHLRHSMILQTGANGNVFAYNYSFDPYWTTFPNNASGDMVLHGNYPFTNLFEQNICQNIVIDNSHGPNGPYNTFLRNRAGGYGIFFSATNSPNQNFLGNDITNLNFPYSLVNYTILGNGHFIYGNNNKGNIHPSGTQILPDSSYAYLQRPDFVSVAAWAGIGTPNAMGGGSIPALDRVLAGDIFSTSCNYPVSTMNELYLQKDNLLVFPVPVSDQLNFISDQFIGGLTITNLLGKQIVYVKNPGKSFVVDASGWKNGIYFLDIQFLNKTWMRKKIVR